MIEFLRSLWSQDASRERGSKIEYALLASSSDPADHENEPSDDGYEPKYLEAPPSITWQMNPTFFISVNLVECRRLSKPYLLPLLPSFLRTRTNKTVRKLYPTSYLHGLRGTAALLVVFHHYAYAFTASSLKGWNAGEEGSQNWFLQLPIIRVVHSGRFMVAIFFVISGYVLSYRSLKLAREGNPIELLDSLASSVFRRWLRLHLPVIASTFVTFLLARANVWTDMPAGWEHSPTGTYLYPKPALLPGPEGSLVEQLADWYGDTQQLCDPFRYGAITASAYNINVLWTIPLEWMGSMLVFVTVLGIARMHTWVKLSVLIYLFYWCHHTARWEPATFTAGIFLAELSFIRVQYFQCSTFFIHQYLSTNPKLTRYLEMAGKLFWAALFVFGIYIGSHPQESASTTPGYRTLMALVPTQYTATNKTEIYWVTIGGVIVVFALENASSLQAIFTTSFAQYLGNISFSLYMLHMMVLCTLGTWLAPKAMDLTGGWSNGQAGFLGAMALVVAVTGPVTFWVSDVFSRGVDEKSVTFARWLAMKCFANAP